MLLGSLEGLFPFFGQLHSILRAGSLAGWDALLAYRLLEGICGILRTIIVATCLGACSRMSPFLIPIRKSIKELSTTSFSVLSRSKSDF